MKALIFRETGEPKSVLKLADICTDDEDLRARLRELTAGKGVERAIDCVAGELGAEVARNLAPAGTMLVYGALSSHRQTDPAKFTMPLFAPRLIYSAATVRGWWLPHWVSSPAARRSSGSDERSPHQVAERSTYAASDCAVFT